MTRYYLLLLLPALLFANSNIVTAQNHVPNAGFEEHTGCPTALMQLNHCSKWTSVKGSPDYYHTCGSGDTDIPNNGSSPDGQTGYQNAFQGNAYVGFMPYNPYHFEYLTAPITPMVKGQKYEVSMYVNLTNWSSLATDNIGVFFYDKGYKNTPSTPYDLFMYMLPQVHYGSFGIIRDTTNWVKLSKEYIADSAYSHIIIGGFNDSTGSFSKDTVNPGTIKGYAIAYYFIDSVSIRPIYPASAGNLQGVNNLNLYPTPNDGRFTLKGNVQPHEKLNLTILNTIGQVVYSQTVTPQQDMLHQDVQLNGAAKGMYLLRVTNATGYINTVKFMVE